MSVESENLLPSTEGEDDVQIISSRRIRASPAGKNSSAFLDTLKNKRRRKFFVFLLCLAPITYFTVIRIFDNDSIGLVQPTRPVLFTRVNQQVKIREISTESSADPNSSLPTTEISDTSSVISSSSPPITSPSTVELTSENLEYENSTESSTEDDSETTDTILSESTDNSKSSESIISTSTIPPTKSSSDVACKIPKLDPWSPSVKTMIEEKYPPSKCREKYDLIFDIEIGINSTLVQIENPKKFGWKNCCYKLVYRGFPNASDPDDSEKFSEKCYSLKKKRTQIPQSHEFIAVYCDHIKNSTIKEKMLDVFAVAPLKLAVEERLSIFYENSNVTADDQVNLVVLGIDAVSHMNFKRVMPKVRKYLMEKMAAISMDGYTKIGDNTFPNILALLTAQNVSESNNSCSRTKFFDKCPLLWKNFAKKGYRTSFGEDSPWMGCFTYLKNGFKFQPTDYYLRSITRVAEEEIEYDHRGNAHICYGPRLSFQFLLNYMKSMAITMGVDKRYFQLIWSTSLTHDYLNLGHMGEPFLLEFLKWISETEYMNKTVFVLTSDHGIRWGAIRSTHQGKIEESMPFIYFVFPDWFKKKFSNAITNFSNNKDRLTTPFDAYETFSDILNLNKITNQEVEVRERKLIKNSKEVPRGISLFFPIPKGRTCEMAEIAEHWCICHNTEEVSLSDKSVQQAANFAVFHLNKMIAKFTQCAYLSLAAVEYAQLVYPRYKKIFGEKGEKVLEILFVTSPGNGTFDATVVKNSKSEWEVSGIISRISLYGNESYCVPNKDMKKYCYCNTLR